MSQLPAKSKFTDHLKALLLGGAITLGASQSASAAGMAQPTTPADSLDVRLERLRQQVKENPTDNAFRTGNGPQEGADVQWWRNAWGNGGWHNWHNGWGNGWHNGGWGNWHNW